MRLAHVRERHAPAGTGWRLAAALDPAATSWVDLEVARRRAVAAQPSLAHDSTLHRQPVTTLDDHLARGLRVDALADLVEGFAPRGDDGRRDPRRGGHRVRAADPSAALVPRLLRLRAPRRHDVAAAGPGDPRGVAPAADLLLLERLGAARSRATPSGRHAARTSSTTSSRSGRSSTRPSTTSSPERGEEAIGGYFILNDWSARDLQRDETTVRLGPAKGKDFATSIGPWLVTPDELADRRAPGATGPDLAMTATVRTADGRVVETSRGTLASMHHAFGAMIARASADVHLRPGEIIGSGTVGGGCLLEIRDETLGRYLEPGDEVTLEVERLGRLVTPIVARPPTR